MVTQTDGKITALYERLSRDDNISGDSNSVVNQKLYLEGYAAQHGYKNCVHYTDDGWSGGNFERPAWKRLVEDIEAGKVAHVLAKDMSRIGRDYLQTGFYTEVMFRQHGVHFVAIGNNVDSDDQSSSEFAPFLNIMNEWYLRDISRKHKAALKIKGELGKPLSPYAVYGYKNDPADKNHWLIDEEPAAVVRRMYRMCVAGSGPYAIAQALFEDKIEKPAVYQAKRGLGPWKYRKDYPNPYNWSGGMVKRILTMTEYAGDTVNFKTYTKSYKDKHSLDNPKEKWLIFRDTHEAIVDRETWELVQKLLGTPRRQDTIGEANPLTGLVFCADCGAKMHNHRARENKENHRPPLDAYSCSTYNNTFRDRAPRCSSHRITTKALRELILHTVKAVSTLALSDREAFIGRVREASELKQAEAVRDVKRKLNKDIRRRDELDGIIKKLYESFALGRINDERFDTLLAEYENEQKALKTSIEEAEGNIASFEKDTFNAERFLELAEKYTDFSELTTPMINEFIDRIVVHKAEKIDDGDRVQQVDVYLNFIGQFELPEPEPTEEEKKREDYLKRKRIRDRDRREKIKAGIIVEGVIHKGLCKTCGKPFETKQSKRMFCSPVCRERFYQMERKKNKPPVQRKKREPGTVVFHKQYHKTCKICGKDFVSKRIDAIYSSSACGRKAHKQRVRQRKRAAKEQATIEQTMNHD